MANKLSVLEKCAEILVECGYADEVRRTNYPTNYPQIMWKAPELDHLYESVEPFADTLAGRKQADAIEQMLDGLLCHDLWVESETKCTNGNNHQWRLDRIKWCINELIK